jgi:thioredoxin-dependent peroxiredoxin
MTKLKIGDQAPDFKAVDQDGRSISLADYKGKKVIIYFYPKDNTPGCTAEACSLRDGYEILTQSGYDVIGVSADSEKTHQGFATKHNLPFRLIADTDKKVIQTYGAWGEKKMYGKSYEGIIRTTFLISEDGKIENIIDKVNTKNHAGQIMEGAGK